MKNIFVVCYLYNVMFHCESRCSFGNGNVGVTSSMRRGQVPNRNLKENLVPNGISYIFSEMEVTLQGTEREFSVTAICYSYCSYFRRADLLKSRPGCSYLQNAERAILKCYSLFL